MAGPRTRAPLNIAELSETALPTSSGPTISMANDWRTGMSTALAQPRARASTMTIQSSTTPLRVSTARIAARTIITAWTAMSVWRLGRTSASTPANRPEEEDGQELGGRHDAQPERVAVGQLEDEPGLGDLLHPGADQRDGLAG